MPPHDKSGFSGYIGDFVKFALLLKNDLRIAVGRLFEALEAFFEKYFSILSNFSKMALEMLCAA